MDPSLKVTVPTVTGTAELVTVAANVTELFGALVNEGLSEEFTVVTVPAAEAVVMVMLHPPERDPVSPSLSSTMYRFHVPFGLMPLNLVANVALPNGAAKSAGEETAGAGDGKLSVLGEIPEFTDVGWNVPDTNGPELGSWDAAASSSVMVTLAAAVVPPTSENRSN